MVKVLKKLDITVFGWAKLLGKTRFESGLNWNNCMISASCCGWKRQPWDLFLGKNSPPNKDMVTELFSENNMWNPLGGVVLEKLGLDVLGCSKSWCWMNQTSKCSGLVQVICTALLQIRTELEQLHEFNKLLRLKTATMGLSIWLNTTLRSADFWARVKILLKL
ncbi:Putative ABC transporter ATP-binding protein spr0430 [Frankliniella fusca]|uniref:ABC transporter ATP-binding protein spr0430 n=1 Tax=Frankliniella fusca TaxID=407009 RepID=A0AAE1HML7_9NEOP|nr:Putative ABC transporter ATP-binding protein spr0430 [Frankliniella fusca]